MILKNRNIQPNAVMLAGMVFIVLANLSMRYIHPSARFSEGIVDGATGFVYGIAIALLLLSVVMRRRKGCGEAK